MNLLNDTAKATETSPTRAKWTLLTFQYAGAIPRKEELNRSYVHVEHICTSSDLGRGEEMVRDPEPLKHHTSTENPPRRDQFLNTRTEVRFNLKTRLKLIQRDAITVSRV